MEESKELAKVAAFSASQNKEESKNPAIAVALKQKK